MSLTATCNDCGKEYGIGEWPLCPHGEPRGMHTFKPYIDENIASEPVLITSWQQRRNLMKANNSDYHEFNHNKLKDRRDREEFKREERRKGHLA